MTFSNLVHVDMYYIEKIKHKDQEHKANLQQARNSHNLYIN